MAMEIADLGAATRTRSASMCACCLGLRWLGRGDLVAVWPVAAWVALSWRLAAVVAFTLCNTRMNAAGPRLPTVGRRKATFGRARALLAPDAVPIPAASPRHGKPAILRISRGPECVPRLWPVGARPRGRRRCAWRLVLPAGKASCSSHRMVLASYENIRAVEPQLFDPPGALNGQRRPLAFPVPASVQAAAETLSDNRRPTSIDRIARPTAPWAASPPPERRPASPTGAPLTSHVSGSAPPCAFSARRLSDAPAPPTRP